MPTCSRCQSFGLTFNRHYAPEEFIEGDRGAQIWIVGLNPAQDIHIEATRRSDELAAYFDQADKVHGYFARLRNVAPFLRDQLGQPGGVAHTDLVKCSSNTWPPPNVVTGKHAKSQIIDHCGGYLRRQIEQGQPKLILCNGADVADWMIKQFPPPISAVQDLTSYIWEDKHHRMGVALSGFIGRIDNYAKRRLGQEIMTLMQQLGIEAFGG